MKDVEQKSLSFELTRIGVKIIVEKNNFADNFDIINGNLTDGRTHYIAIRYIYIQDESKTQSQIHKSILIKFSSSIKHKTHV